ncbi:hypothetical protein [Phyllobacterium phragmitis]|nr:hypothetical protein [Phyllobacterium phragmitis]
MRVRQIGGYSDLYVKTDSARIVRHNIEVGDTVDLRGEILDPCRGVVLSISNDHLWVDLGGGDYGTWWIDKVSRIDPEEMQNPAGEIIQSDAGESMEADPLTDTSPVGSVSPTPVPSDA